MLQLLPNFFPSEVRALISDFKIGESTGLSFFYTFDAFTYLSQLGVRPGTSSTDIDHPYEWPINWDLNGFLNILEPRSFLAPLSSTHSALLTLLLDLGSHFTRALITALLAPNGHFPGLLLATLTGLQAGHTTLCVQGIFGSGKTYSASLLLVVLSSILDINCVLTAEPNLPLATAIEIIDILLQDASNPIRDQYARCLANQVKSSSPLDCSPEDRSQLLRNDSSLRCLLITQGSLLRDLCREHPAFQTFLTTCKVAINDEAQQGGQAGSTILASFLDRRCLQLLIGDKEQTHSGTGGEPTKEALLTKLAMKSIGFLHSPFPLLPSEFVEKLTRALRPISPFSNLLPDDPDVHCLISLLLSNTYPAALCPATVHQAEGVTAISDITLNLILPQSLRCPADPYFTQVATHYPHLHRQLDDGLVRYGHFEDTPAEVQATRIYRDMHNTPHHCSGYRAIQWHPSLLAKSTNMERPSILNVLRVAAVISYFTARSIHLRHESSKLLLLAPHNDTIDDLESLMGAAAPDYPPTLYDFYLACIYRQDFLAENLDKFQFTNHQGTTITPVAQAVTTLAIHKLISADPTLQSTLESRASLPTIVNIALTYPRGFVTYCTISNTVKAIGIGGSASLFLSAKFTSFIAASDEADARNLVALTRSKGLSVILLPPATQYVGSPLHSLLTQCAYRHGIFTIDAEDLDTEALADFLSQPDTTENAVPAVFTAASWLHTHQISTFGTWDPMPLCLALTYNAQISYFYLSLNQHSPPSNTHHFSAGYFEWSGKLIGSPPTPATISFGRSCLLLLTENSKIVEFPFPTAADGLVEARGFGLRPVSGSHFFTRPSHGLGHKHPIRSSTPHPPPPLPLPIQRWPATSPATTSPDLPEYEDPPPPDFLSTGAKHLYMQGINYLHSQDCLYNSALKPEDWLAAYGAIIVPDFTEQILGALLDSSVVSEFATEIVEPLANRHDTTQVFNFLHRTLSAQQIPWTIFVPRHRTVVDPTPPEDDLVRIIPRDEFPSIGGWIDNIAEKIDHLVSLLTQADDIPRSRQGWIHLSALKRYDGPAVPGNQDPHTNTILYNRPFTLSRGGSSTPLDDAALFNLVAFDNRRRKYRLTLGEYRGPTRNQLVIALSSDLPRPMLDRAAPAAHRRSMPSPSAPLTVSNIPPFGVYFCRKPTLTALRRDGIHPTAQSSRQGNPLNIALKLQASRHSEMSDLVYHSPLNQQRLGLYVFINLPATLEAGFTWFMLDSQKGIIGTPKVPLPASFFHSAMAIESGQPVHHWIPSPHEPTSHPPRNRLPVGAPTADATETYLNTHSDIRLEQILRAPPVISTGVDPSDSHPPRESDHDTEILSQSATEAFQRLIAAIDNPPSTPLDIDHQLYSALAGLSSSHPWSTLVLDLKGVLPELDRHFHTHLLSGLLQAQIVPSTIQLLNQLLQSLSSVIVDILAPATSNFDLPEIESVFFTHQFWHHHLVHCTNTATPARLDGAPNDTLLGNQLCQWSSIGTTEDSLLLASHLTVHLPPCIGAYVLANHKPNASLVTDPAVAGTNSRANYIVRQRTQYRSPIMGSEHALTAARNSALAGHIPPGLIPFLASPNADIIQHRLNWTLRFPLPGPAPDDPHAHRFANLSLHASGHSSNESLRNAIQLHQTFSQTNAMVTNPTFLRVPDPSNGTGQLTHSPVALDHTVARWLREGAGSPLALTPIHRPARSSPWLFSRFSTESLASPNAATSSPSTSLTLENMLAPQLKNLPELTVR